MKKIFYIVLVLCFFSCRQPEVVFDIPPLVGKDIDEVNKILGGTAEELTGSDDLSRNYSYMSYQKDKYLLTIRYNARNRKIELFHLLAQKKSFDKYADMLKIGNLDSTSRAYSVESNPPLVFNDYDNVRVYLK